MLPSYRTWTDVPAHLKTKTQLAKEGLRPSKGQPPAAVKTSTYRYTPDYYLYDIALSVPKSEPSTEQLERLAKGRETAQLNRTCSSCGELFGEKLVGRLCDDCRRRRRDYREAVVTARDWVGSNSVILDTETTGLIGEIVQIAMVDMAGNTLVNSLVKPTVGVGYGAYQIHGISDEALVDAATIADLYPRLAEIFRSVDRVIVYNLEFDMGRLEQSLVARGVDVALYDLCRWDCAMHLYARFVGEWNSRRHSYRWQRLEGGDHSALGDCLATLNVLKRMAISDEELA